jgi:ribosomal protein L35
MPKIKTRKSASKRIAKITKGGKVIRRKITAQHLARKKSKRTRKTAGDKIALDTTDRKIINLLPYK